MRIAAALRGKEFLSCLLIAVAVAAAFAPALANGFTNFDDNAYLTDNPLVRSLAPANLLRIFTTTPPHTLFNPLVTLSFAIEYRLWGLEPLGYHAVNLLLHLGNALLAFFLIRALAAPRAAALLASLLFALHPLRVESVAWVTERKDLLSTLFLLLALLAYRRFLKEDSGRAYLAALLLFAAAVLAKMSALVLPALLLLMDWRLEKRVGRRRWLEKIPFAVILLLYGAGGWIGVQAHSTRFAGGDAAVMAGNSLRLVPFYLQKTLWPARLSPHYPTDMRFFMPSPWPGLLLAAALLAATFFLLRRLRRDWLWGWGFFLVALLPTFAVIWNFFPAANRYSYLPAVGLSHVLALCAWRIGAGLKRRPGAAKAWAALLACALALLAAISFQRCRVWKDSLSLWNDVIAKYPVIPLAFHNRASALKAVNRLSEAHEDYSRAITLLPHASFFWNRGLLQLQRGREAEAAGDFFQSLLRDPGYLGLFARMAIDRHGAAGRLRVIEAGRRLLAIRADARIHAVMAEQFAALGRRPEAERHLREALRLEPHNRHYRRAMQALRAAPAAAGAKP